MAACAATWYEEPLQPGETREAVMEIDPKMLCYWDPAMLLQTRPDGTKDKWVTAAGEREILVGASSRDIRASKEVTLK